MIMSLNQLCILLTLSCTFLCTNCQLSDVPRYTINLDLPPEQRFSQICRDFGPYLRPVLREIILHKIPAKYVPLCEKIAASLDEFFPWPFSGEMRGVAKECNITLGAVVLLNLFYESTAYCTSIVATDLNGRILHGRNFDYDHVEFLRNITYVADFKSKEMVLYSAVMFAGHMGVATGQKPHSFSISIDERDQGFWWENLFEALFRKSRTVGFLSRQVLGTDGITFNQAVRWIANTSLIAPAYFILGGIKPTDGAVITHGRDQTDDIWLLNPQKKRWFLVETNYDHWTTPPPDDDRRHPAEKAMNTTGQQNISPESLSKVLSMHPVLNEATVYTTIMSADTPEMFHTHFP